MRRGPTVNRTVPCNQGGEVSRRLDFITILLHFLFSLYFPPKTEYTDYSFRRKGGVRMDDFTRKFSIVDEKDAEIHQHSDHSLSGTGGKGL